jgi:hypothetical protein
MPLDQAGETRRLHDELDQVRRDGWDCGARVSLLERRIVHIGGIVLGVVRPAMPPGATGGWRRTWHRSRPSSIAT